jgi:hypothetical protein
LKERRRGPLLTAENLWLKDERSGHPAIFPIPTSSLRRLWIILRPRWSSSA